MSHKIGFSAFFAVMLVVLMAGNMLAQGPTVNLAGSATVLSALTFTQTHAVAFGNVTASRTAVLDPQGVANQFVGSTAGAGAITIHGANNTPVIVTYPATMTLTDGTPAEDLTLTLSVTGDKLAANQASSAALASGAAVTTALATDANPGDFYLWVGGSLPTSTVANTFSGSATFSVEYQ